MKVAHKILSTGYHYVRATEYAHLFAQWTVGTQLSYDQISHGEMPMSDTTLAKFIDAAQRAADENYDPTPWCAACGTRTKAQCKCLPIARNE